MSRRIIPLLVLAVTLLLIWLTAPVWLAWLIRAQLQQAGFSHVSCDIDHVGLSELRMHHLSAERNHAHINVEARQITARYSLTGLLQRHLSSLHAGQLNIFVHTSADIGTGSGGIIVLSQLALLQQLPFNQAAIDKIRLLHFNSRQQPDLELDGHAVYTRNHIDLHLQDRAATQLAQLTLDQQGAFSLRLQHEQQPALVMQGTLHDQQQRLHMDADIHIDLANINALLMRWGLQLDLQPTGNLDIKGQASLPRNRPLTRDLLAQLIAKADFQLQAGLLNDTASVKIAGELEITHGQGKWHIENGAEIRIGQHDEQTTLTSYRLGGTISLLSSPPQLMLQRSSRLDIRNLKQGDWSVPLTGITLEQDLLLSFKQPDTLLQATKLHINIPTIRRGQHRLALPDIHVQLQNDATQTCHGQIQIPHISLTNARTTVRMEPLQASFRLTRQHFSAQWHTGLTPGLARIDGDIAIDMQSGAGQLHYRTDTIDVSRRQNAVHIWLNNFAPRILLQQGKIRASGDIRWKGNTIRAQTRLQLDTISGSWREQPFRDLQAICHLRYDGHSVVLPPCDIRAGKLHGPIPLQALSMQLAGSWPLTGNPAISISHLSVRLLGGTAKAAAITLRPERSHNPFAIQLEHIDLAAIIALEQQQGLQVQGYLNGTLPMDLTTEGLQLQHGQLQAIPPGGIIRYTGSASIRRMASSNMGVDLALQVLSDFRFRRMDIQADYVPEGTLHMDVQLQGHNPTYDNGRPITFNLNIEENILQLIKSLQLAGNIEKNVRKKLQGE